MNKILDDTSYPIEERLEMAKILLELKDCQIQKLATRLDKEKSYRGWVEDQSIEHRMGL